MKQGELFRTKAKLVDDCGRGEFVYMLDKPLMFEMCRYDYVMVRTGPGYDVYPALVYENGGYLYLDHYVFHSDKTLSREALLEAAGFEVIP